MVTKRNKLLYDVSIPLSGAAGSQNLYIDLADLDLPGGDFDETKATYILEGTALNLSTFAPGTAGSTRRWSSFVVSGPNRAAFNGTNEPNGVVAVTFSAQSGQTLSVTGYGGGDTDLNDDYLFYRQFNGVVTGAGATKTFVVNSNYNMYMNEAQNKIIIYNTTIGRWEVARSSFTINPSGGGGFLSNLIDDPTASSEVKDNENSPEDASFTEGAYVNGPLILTVNLSSATPNSEVKFLLNVLGYSED